MWYEQILELLLDKIHVNDQKTGQLFLETLLTRFKENFYQNLDDNHIPLEIPLGIIDKMYCFFSHQAPNSVRLDFFAQVMLGLLIIYSKSSDDEAFWNEDFKSVINDVDISLALRSYPVISLTQVERSVLQRLNYQITIDFAHLITIFTELPDRRLLNDMYLQNLDLIGNNPVFDDFMTTINNLRIPEMCIVGHCRLAKPDVEMARLAHKHWSVEENIFSLLISELEPKLDHLAQLAKEKVTFRFAYQAGVKLEEQLHHLIFAYISDKNTNTYQQFKINCFHTVDKAIALINSCSDPVIIHDWQTLARLLKKSCNAISNNYASSLYTSKIYANNLFFHNNRHNPPAPTMALVIANYD